MPFAKGNIPWNKDPAKWDDCVCKMCGSHFLMLHSQIIRDGRGQFCGKKCFYDAKKKFSKRAKVKELYEQGLTYREIATRLESYPATIGSMVYSLKLNNRFGDAITSQSSMSRLKGILKKYHGINQCELCGYDRVTEIAHIVEKRNGGGFFLDNCLLLCPNCHHLFDYKMIHNNEKQKLLSIPRLNGNLRRRLAYESV